MKTTLAFIAAGMFATSLYALPDYDPFADASGSGGTTYAVGSNLIGQQNAQGLSWFQAGPTGVQPQPTIAAGNLTVSGLMPPSGNSVSFGGANGDSARLGLGGAVTSGTVYYSMALEVTALGGLTTGGAIAAGFNNSTGSQTGQPSVIGTSLELRLSGTGYNVGVNKGTVAGNIVWGSGVFNVGSTLFLVGSYTFNSSSTSDDVSSLWINPDSSTFGVGTAPTADLTTSAGGDISANSIASFLVREASTIEPTMTLDELRIGANWSDVTPPVPEPSTFALAALGLVVLRCRRLARQ